MLFRTQRHVGQPSSTCGRSPVSLASATATRCRWPYRPQRGLSPMSRSSRGSTMVAKYWHRRRQVGGRYEGIRASGPRRVEVFSVGERSPATGSRGHAPPGLSPNCDRCHTGPVGAITSMYNQGRRRAPQSVVPVHPSALSPDRSVPAWLHPGKPKARVFFGHPRYPSHRRDTNQQRTPHQVSVLVYKLR